VVGAPLTLAQARWLAGQVRHGVAVKEDPGEKRQAARRKDRDDRDNFDVVARNFLERYARRNTRASTAGEMANLLGFTKSQELRKLTRTRALETWPALRWRGRKLQTITRRDVNELLEAIVDAGVPSAANATLAVVRRLFNWAVEQDVLATSPCAGVKRPAPLVERDRVLTDAELRLVWFAADQMAWPFGHLVKLLALTGARREEWAGARWDEVDLTARVFHLTAARTKNGVALDLPLSPQAVAVLEAVAEHRLAGKPDWLFSTGTGRANAATLAPISGFSKAKRQLDAAMLVIQRREAAEAGIEPEPTPPWRIHDLRRTTVTGMARLGVALPVIERSVNHISGSFSGVVGVYQRHSFADEIRDAMERWGAAVERISRGDAAVPSNVVALKR
jgi:integrase